MKHVCAAVQTSRLVKTLDIISPTTVLLQFVVLLAPQASWAWQFEHFEWLADLKPTVRPSKCG